MKDMEEHIVRSTGRKDRHSKVYTAKGLRDRRVRLSAHTAIQFYDVQDRLGYDRPSKAVDWLIMKAKAEIDKLAELPSRHPTATNTIGATTMEADQGQNNAWSRDMPIAEQEAEPSGYSFHLHRQLVDNNPTINDSFFITTSTIGPDTIKSLFPLSSATTSSIMNFQDYPNTADIIPRTRNGDTQDFGLSLHSFQDQNLTPSNDHNPFAGTVTMGYEASLQRIVGWSNNPSTENRTGGAGCGFVFDPPPPPPPPQQASLLGQDLAFSQRGSLQSSFSQLFWPWNDLTMASEDHHRAQEILHQSSIFHSGFASDGLPCFSILARLNGEEDRGVVSYRPSSSSPSSQH